ncbi:adenylate kinase [Nocardioides sp. Root1257]|uniref:adenylate kinase n=1 Tax=unclassified Nocardioides TaxID=2615069 RepID=UPI0006FD2494|nr:MULTISPECIES: adenylate kinase [unclassified Nocardioides]KQW45012.1 adenylate kinase [Nocardioides sp. Root1257]KRC45984.1 adenylate kinase [Nocardioides sp. Root224]
MRLIMMGPPGAGKGTQAKRVAQHFKIPAISTGDIFRAHVSRETDLGKEAKGYLEVGEYVPDEVTNLMLRDRLDEEDAVPGFVLDGYPRTIAQVAELDGMLHYAGYQVDRVICLSVEHDQLIARLLDRSQLEGRSDDTEPVIRRRQEIFLEQTAGLVSVYRDRGLLAEIDGSGDVSQVTERVLSSLQVGPLTGAGHG